MYLAGGHEVEGRVLAGCVLIPVSFASFPSLFSCFFSIASACNGSWLMGCWRNVAFQE